MRQHPSWLLVLVTLMLASAGGAEKQQPDQDQHDSEETRSEGVTVVDPGREHTWVGEPISLSLKDADLVEVLRSFAELAHVNIVIDPRVEGTVTLELEEVPWDQALYVILKSHGLAVDIGSHRLWTLSPRPQSPPRETGSDD
jgi:type II secretory pathway component HofQ